MLETQLLIINLYINKSMVNRSHSNHKFTLKRHCESITISEQQRVHKIKSPKVNNNNKTTLLHQIQ